jgi:hypothetical protein
MYNGGSIDEPVKCLSLKNKPIVFVTGGPNGLLVGPQFTFIYLNVISSKCPGV